MNKKIKVLIVDGSSIFRQTLSRILTSDPAIEVMATASDPFMAANKMTAQIPDVITLDIEMPRMNGITFLKKIMAQYPIPVIIISGIAKNNMALTIKAMENGAVEVMAKSVFEEMDILEEYKIKIRDIIKRVAHIKLKRKLIAEAPLSRPKFSADAVLNQIKPRNLIYTNDKVIAVGASTGGTIAISTFLEALPAEVPGIVIVQHMPENFTRSFADRLNEICKISVKEAEDGDIVKPGRALIAPGNHHLLLKKRGTQYYVEVKDGPLVNRHRPAVDVLFRSVALYAGKNSIGILMTGMGDDGAKGLLEMKEAGAKTIAQDEKSCVVFGMPKEAILLNAADKVLPINDIANHVMKNIHCW
ncbi:MAG: chemotaxis response regulator protein-glutamate methylesterase [Ferruginibacter sp.]